MGQTTDNLIKDFFADIEGQVGFNYNARVDRLIKEFVTEARIGNFEPYIKIDRNLREVTILIFQKLTNRLDRATFTFDQLKNDDFDVMESFVADESRRDMSDEVQLSVDGFEMYTLTN